MFLNKSNISIQRWDYIQYQNHMEEIKTLRKTYRYYPYLYCYDEIEEQEYQNAYLTAGKNLDAFVAIFEDSLIGISVGCHLSKNIIICSDLVNTNLNKGKPYYFGDIIIEKKYWGLSLASELYKHHIEFIKQKNYTSILALLVERDNSDPRKPVSYRKSNLWFNFDFIPTNFTVNYKWNTYYASSKAMPENHILRAYEKKL